MIIVEKEGICQGKRNKLGYQEWDDWKEAIWDNKAYIDFSNAPNICSLW